MSVGELDTTKHQHCHCAVSTVASRTTAKPYGNKNNKDRR